MKTNETGRSMVEMLGVLAIIGVLSIGGIMGYTTAMNRYRANEILDVASKYATIACTCCQTQKTLGGTDACETAITFDNTGLDKPTGVAADDDAISAAITGTNHETVTVTITFDATYDKVGKAAASAVGQTYDETDHKFAYAYTMN